MTTCGWSDLHSDLLTLICTRLIRIADHVRFSSICVLWRSVALENRHLLPRQPPVLLLHDQDRSETLTFLSPYTRTIYRVEIPEFQDKMLCGVFQEWLVAIDDMREFHLVSPFSRFQTQIKLSSVIKFRDELLKQRKYYNSILKFVLSSNPNLDADYEIMGIDDYSKDLCIFKPCYGWAKGNDDLSDDDIIYFNGAFYVAKSLGYVGVYDSRFGPGEFVIPIPPVCSTLIPWMTIIKLYLVESSGNLLLVRRIHSYFEVYRLDTSNGRWTKVKSLGDQVIFLAEKFSMSFSAHDFPECKANSIYCNDMRGSRCYIVVFNLNDGVLEYFDSILWGATAPAIWVKPCLR
ncbi:hypothetical protein GIB67_036082 [Kingdonia uniflora]|uniref:KIB1-4 beta-propeller domain-containing protein n=1 Tax=Kingdonia uniflora TaxID=39325 RepID=A0A7J7N9C4_9MAGN|nr:hypothetical protein GIB67_036082 [Kingdonia uniflora]